MAPSTTLPKRASKGITAGRRIALANARAAAARRRAEPPAPAPAPVLAPPPIVLPEHIRPKKRVKGLSAARRAHLMIMQAKRLGTLDALLASVPPGIVGEHAEDEPGVKGEEDANVKIEETE
jgi:hypothetical protein